MKGQVTSEYTILLAIVSIIVLMAIVSIGPLISSPDSTALERDDVVSIDTVFIDSAGLSLDLENKLGELVTITNVSVDGVAYPYRRYQINPLGKQRVILHNYSMDLDTEYTVDILVNYTDATGKRGSTGPYAFSGTSQSYAFPINLSEPIADDLLSYYKFDDGPWFSSVGNVEDSKGLSLGARGINNPVAGSGVFGEGLLTDGTTDRAETESEVLYNISGDNFTYSIWFYADISAQLFGSGSSAVLFWRQDNRPRVYLHEDNRIVVNSYCQDGGNQDAINNSWNHVVYTYNTDLDAQTLYVNGVSTYTEGCTSSRHPGDDARDNYIRFARDDSSLRHFNGTLDEFMFWNRSLSASEVQNLYNRGQLSIS